MNERKSLLLVFVVAIFLLGGSGSPLALDTAGSTTTVGGVECKVNMLLGVESNDEGGDVDNLLANTRHEVSRLGHDGFPTLTRILTEYVFDGSKHEHGEYSWPIRS